jgi:hypothetical protein
MIRYISRAIPPLQDREFSFFCTEYQAPYAARRMLRVPFGTAANSLSDAGF